MTLDAGGAIRLKSWMIEGSVETPGNRQDAYLWDGQQRLTALYQSLRHEGAVDTHANRRRRNRRSYYITTLVAIDPNHERENAIGQCARGQERNSKFRSGSRPRPNRLEFEDEQHMMSWLGHPVGAPLAGGSSSSRCVARRKSAA